MRCNTQNTKHALEIRKDNCIYFFPFGAPYADPAAVSGADFQPYKYNGKELDKMHGLNTYDYGARQYYSILGRWDRVDPLCEKYYSISPYAYVNNNPMNRIDPDGCDDYMLNREGHFILIKETMDDFHMLYATNLDGSMEKDKNIIVSKSFMNSKETRQYTGRRISDLNKSTSEYQVDFFTSSDEKESVVFFEFAANNTDVEWSNTRVLSPDGNRNIVATSHDERSELGQRAIIDGVYGISNPYSRIKYANHSHLPSSVGYSYGDIQFAKDAVAKNPNIVLQIYNGNSYKTFDQYDIPGKLEEVICKGRKLQEQKD